MSSRCGASAWRRCLGCQRSFSSVRDDMSLLSTQIVDNVAVVRFLSPEGQFSWGTRVWEHRINPSLIKQVNQALDEAENAGVQALLVTGEGKFFCNGMDLQYISAHVSQSTEIQTDAENLMRRILTLGMPTVAAVNGHMTAAGAMLGLSFDKRLMPADSKSLFFIPGIDIGLVYSPGMTELMKAKMPLPMWTDVLCMGKRYKSEDLLKHGVVEATPPPSDLFDAAMELAKSLKSKGKDQKTRDTWQALRLRMVLSILAALVSRSCPHGITLAMAFVKGSHWQYRCPFRKAWVDVSADEDRQLKEAYLALPRGGQPVAMCKIGSLKFSTDFRNLIRTNVASKRTMEVRLRDGDLPFPTPKGPEAPSEASLGANSPESIAPCELEAARTVPHSVRKAWGHGIESGITMSGEFEFTMEASEKELFGEMLSWNMLAAGISPQSLDNRCLKFTSSQGEVSMGSKKEIAKMLGNPRAYPIHISYKPHPAFKFVAPQYVPHMEVTRTMLKFTQTAVAELDGKLDNVKHKHQRRTFERYLLYLEDHYYQTGDDLSDALDMEAVVNKYPETAFSFLLINKTGPGLSKILRGEIDVLEYLFGG
ncbi:Delta(2)-enoyl CoA isomerase 1) (AtECI1) [Durusdinium trenchii]|uniref:Peroxisomal (Delta(3)) n=1 Tax=Durusdinium trenchii TaxID=1381693 RepID=A0ABP0S3I3_9DINO